MLISNQTIIEFMLLFFLLGYFHFSVSWILLAVFIYLFRQHQRTQFKERHKMLSEINNGEEQYIKARLDELPSWVLYEIEYVFSRNTNNYYFRFSSLMLKELNG